MTQKTYAVVDFDTKREREIAAPSFEAALEVFCGEAPEHGPFHTVRGIRMYHIGGQTIGITLASKGRRR